MTGLTQHQFRIWCSGLFGKLFFCFVALLLIGLRWVERRTMSAIKSKPAKRNQAAVVTPTSSLPEKIDRYWLNAGQSGETSMSFEPALGMRMFGRLPVRFRSAMYALRGGFLIRPFAIAMILRAAGAVLSSLEEANPKISAWIPSTRFPSRGVQAWRR